MTEDRAIIIDQRIRKSYPILDDLIEASLLERFRPLVLESRPEFTVPLVTLVHFNLRRLGGEKSEGR
jgi:hypothetical protein